MLEELIKGNIYVPDGRPVGEALSRTTHLGIGAHQDDLEIMAYHGILECLSSDEKWFSGVVVTDGGGSPRKGRYALYSDNQMKKLRVKEQKKAAVIGEYGAMVFMGHPSVSVKDPQNINPRNELKEIIKATRPRIIYTHNPADKHDTHVAVCLRVLEALKEIPREDKPEKIYGCEVWRGLDWVVDDEKTVFDVSEGLNLGVALLGVHDSQISGGKRYDLAVEGRRIANAVFSESHQTDQLKSAIFAVDLTPLLEEKSPDIDDYIKGFLKRLSKDITNRINRLK